MYHVRLEEERRAREVPVRNLPDLAVDLIARGVGVELLDKKRKDDAKKHLKRVPFFFKNYRGNGLYFLSVLYELLKSVIEGTHLPSGFTENEEIPKYLDSEFVLALAFAGRGTENEVLNAQQVSDRYMTDFILGINALELYFNENILVLGEEDHQTDTPKGFKILDENDNDWYTARIILIKKTYLKNLDLVKYDYARLNDFFHKKASNYEFEQEREARLLSEEETKQEARQEESKKGLHRFLGLQK